MYFYPLLYISFLQGIRSDAAYNLSKEDSRIFKGKPAEKGQFSYMVPLWQKTVFLCSCSMITSTTALTAAHCVIRKSRQVVPADQLRIKYGSLDARKGKNIKIHQVIAHPRYRKTNTSVYNDIALLLTKEPLPDKVKPIGLPPQFSEFPEGNCVIEVGWGETKKGGKHDYHLQYTNSELLSGEKCELSSVASKKRICAAKVHGSGICQGDSGGPLVLHIEDGEDITVGVASYVIESCFKNEEGVGSIYTKTSYYTSWIKENAKGEVKILG